MVPANAIPRFSGRALVAPLVLASASPRRVELLTLLGIPFSVQQVNAEEWEEPTADPVELVRENSCRKAMTAAEMLPDSLVLGADTAVSIGDRLLAKPHDLSEARGMLRLLSGREHSVYTGFTLAWRSKGRSEFHCEESRVRFKVLDEGAIDDYLARVYTLDKAGGYGIQAERERIIAGISGSFSNIMGLPLEALLAVLEQGAFFAGPA